MLQTRPDYQIGSDAPPDLIVETLTKHHAGSLRPVLDNLSVMCPAGKITVIVGPSGCGKTTLLRCLCGLETADTGSIMFGATDMTYVDAQYRGVAMVFQNYALYPSKSVAENIAFPLRMAGMGKSERRARVDAAAKLVKIEGLLERKPAQLSGGQRQRVGIARAIVRGPRVLLMDEPLSNLDTKLRAEMRAELSALQRQIGATTVYVTHDQTEALSLADHLIVMRDGRIEQQGNPSDVFRYPASLFIADFLGSMNIIQAQSTETAFCFGAFGNVEIALSDRQELLVGKVMMGFRPEDVRIASPIARQGISFTAEVLRTELLGSDSLIYLSIGGETIRGRLATTARIGDRLQLFIDTADLHYFSPEGQRIQMNGSGA